MRTNYPMPRSVRASLAKMYYDMLCSPGIDPGMISRWLEMLELLIPFERGSRQTLHMHELELSWEKLWVIVKRLVWCSSSDSEDVS